MKSDILIVGAGISGLMAAQQLAGTGRSVVMVDKGRSVGGRLATRRIGAGLADHGAQFFTARSPAFAAIVAHWQAAGWVYTWSTGWSDGSLAENQPDGHPRFAAKGGMNALAKAVAAELTAAGVNIFTGIRLAAVTQVGDAWEATDGNGNVFSASTLVLTAPVPQSLALLDAGEARLTDEQRASLEAIAYAPCLSGLLWIEGDVHLPAPGAIQRPARSISWIADNRQKGISPATVVTVHANPQWSEEHFADADADLTSHFRAAVDAWVDPSAVVEASNVQRWRYAVPTTLHPEPFLRAEGIPPLYFGGDAFGSPRVEGAVCSGLAIGAAIRAG